jgi:glycosyltransferase involved in cell wall biosynthesis
MRFAVVIPAYNEQAFLGQMLDSLLAQTLRPQQVIIVDDSSTDNTSKIATSYAAAHNFIRTVLQQSKPLHLPGSKVVQAFNRGLRELSEPYDVILKLDADLILPTDYFEQLSEAFTSNQKIGMAGGIAQIIKNGTWVKENLADKDHIRGAFKAYRKECFEDIKGLREAMGWDTADELLARYYGWQVSVLQHLHVKHLKPTGFAYDKTARYKQGAAFYSLGYGLVITVIASVKLAALKKNLFLVRDYLTGYFRAQKERRPMLVSPEQAKWIRKYRWKIMQRKIFG